VLNEEYESIIPLHEIFGLEFEQGDLVMSKKEAGRNMEAENRKEE
jgi:hypothetical protein